MKFKPSITFATIQVAVALAIMWACIIGGSHASGRTLGIMFAIGNAMIILGFPGLAMIWVLVKGQIYQKTINEQQDQINELKSELEKMKQDRNNGT